MITLKVVQRTGRLRKDGTCRIEIRITKNRKTTYLPTDYCVLPKQFKDGMGNWVTGHPDAKLINGAIEAKRSKLMEQVVSADIDGRDIDADNLQGKDRKTFFNAAREMLEMYESRKQVAAYTRLKTNIGFVKEAWGRDVHLADLSKEWVKKYVKFRYDKGNTDSTVKKNLTDLAVIINAAGVKGENHFEAYAKTINPKPAHREKLTIEEIRLLEAAKLDGLVGIARDMFLFAFYAQGMRFESVALIERSAIKNGLIEYRMNKGKKIRQIEIHPKLEAIINKYRLPDGGKTYLFPVIKKVPGVWNKKEIVGGANSLINTYLNRAAILAGVNRHIHFHLARHSFAMAALNKGVSYEVLKDSLGHSNFATTAQYLNSLSDEKINKALRDVWG